MFSLGVVAQNLGKGKKFLSKNIVWILMGIIVVQGIVNTVQRRNAENKRQDQIAELIDRLGVVESGVSVIVEGEQRFERYVLTTDDKLKNVLEGQEDLLAIVEKIQEDKDVMVERIERVRATQDSLLVSTQGLVTQTSDTTSLVAIAVDTLGVSVDGIVECPSGLTELSIHRDPLEFIVTLERTDTGLQKKAIEFPGQPWISVRSWDVAISDAASKDKSFFGKLFAGTGVILGVGAEEGGAGPLLGASFKGWQIGAIPMTNGNVPFFLGKQVNLW
jgi:hypothetical protein